MENPVALVTGASSGFGLLATLELAQAGFRVHATMRDPGKRGRLDEAVRAAGGAVAERVSVSRLDVTDAASIDEALRAAGPVDVLVNNAGYGLGGLFEDVSMPELREQMETNFFGVAATMMAVIPGMRERRRGRIINVSSIAGRLGEPGMSAYCASKWAVEGLSEAVRFELLRDGVFVVLVEPGSFRTDIFGPNKRIAARAADPSSPNYELTARAQAVIDRMIDRSTANPRDVARVILRAATAKRPRLRYLVGKDARLGAAAKALLPPRLMEYAVGKYFQRLGR